MLHWFAYRLGTWLVSELGKICQDEVTRQISVTVGLVSSFLFCWTLSDIEGWDNLIDKLVYIGKNVWALWVPKSLFRYEKKVP